ncbi:MAG: hypothetical protein DRG78_16325 [Epsilonproteobacteria bacterium]|nr:MAG: hypothetical protein DRG78_16325 [Campylobacterota bacterium]
MNNKIIKLSMITLLSTIALTQSGCALSDQMLKNYNENTQADRVAKSKTKTTHASARAKLEKEVTSELIENYGTRRGYLIAKKVLVSKNIRYVFEGKDYEAELKEGAIEKAINATRGQEVDYNRRPYYYK